jgi:hypothetical protein
MIEIITKTTYDSVEDLCYVISENLTHEEIFDLIVTLDKIQQDWGFTERAYKHFSNEMKLFEEEKEINSD